MIVVVMGVSGSGKTTVGRLLAQRLDCAFIDADDFHPPANVAKMAAGVPLDDANRRPWLERLNAELRGRQARGQRVVLACSALKQSYRDRLAAGLARCELVYLRVAADVLRARLERRAHHYMPASLLDSQLAALEPPASAIEVDGAQAPERCVEIVATAIAAHP